MAGPVPAGRLSLEIVAEVARLTQDLNRVRSLVKSASGDIAANARAANDNLAGIGRNAGAGIQQFSRDVARLKGQLDPAWASLQRYKQEVQTLQQALREGAITHKQYVDQLRNAVSVYRGTGRTVTTTSGAMRAGMQQLSYQIGDISTQFAMGARPMQIFAAQASQVVGAVGLMTAGSKGFIGFLGGPWGQIIIAATTVLGTLAAAMWNTADTADKTKPSIDRLADAYARLAGNMGKTSIAGVQALADAKIKLETDRAALDKTVGALSAAQKRLDDSRRVDPRGRGSAPLIRNVAELQGELNFLKQQMGVSQNLVRLGEQRFNQTVATEAAEKAAADAKKAASAATRAHNKELSETVRLAREAAKEYEKLAKWIADTRMEAQGNVWQLAEEMEKRQREWGKGEKTWGEENKDALEAAARVREGQLETEYRLLGVYLDQLDAIRQTGGAFNIIGGIVQGMATGNFMSVGGKLGGLLGTIGSLDTGVWAESLKGAAGNDLNDPERIGTTIADHLTKLFRENGEFFRGLKAVLANAAFGSTAASVTGGSKLGGAAGGVIGGKLGEKLLEKPLKDMFGEAFGSLAGPLGSMLGGVLGGAIGGMFKKVKWGAVDISSSGVSASRGNSSTAEKAAVSVGDNIMASLNQIAEAFGGNVGDFGNITVGQRHGDWRVNATGTSLKVKKGATDFNDDAEGAIAYAIQVAIERGAITGIRESTQTLLQASGDLQTKLSKALAFEGVFSDLKQATDPVGYELEELTKKFDGLRKIFAEAGATTEEYTQLEQLLSIQRKGILDQAENERRELEVRLLTAQGKAAEAANLQREIELSQTKDDLKLLMKQVQVEELASQRRSMEITLLEAMGKSTEALTLRRQAELAAMDESLRPLQRSIWYYQDAAQKVSDARDALSAAYSRESSSLQSTADKFRDFAKAISEFRASLFTDVPGVDSYALARSRFDKTANLARLGNEASLSAFTGDAQSYLDAARDRAGSALDYARDVARVAAAADQAQAGANGVASMAERQLNQLTASVKGLIDLNDNVTTVWQAIADLEKAQAEEAEAQAEMDKLTNPVPQLQEVNVNLTDINGIIERLNDTQSGTKEEIAALRSELQSALIAIASNTGESARILRRADRGDALATQVEAA
ncbi:hypothetical protein [Sphingobium sp. CFD-1]|uniref:hypothetical protein n=1 Tax=Sphingobium sp. CFD-1 TaxID=2878545 RepID=UPI00214C9A16|nr:hypothetical protein [Sphingobium sp. CFD-1]